MRVIGGKYRHRLLSWPEDVKHIRPTKDRIREAIFNALNDIEGLKSLDLYSGSGSMGIESLSRGCSFCTFVDINKIALKTTGDNLKSLNINKNEYEIIPMEDMKALESFKQKGQFFDLIFLDPPYKEGKYEEVISYILNNSLISEKGIIVVESDHEVNFDSEAFKQIRKYTYGEIKVWILWR